MKRGIRGFTVLELLVVIVIIGILASIALPVVKKATYQAKMTILRVKMFSHSRFNTMNNLETASQEDVDWALTNTPATFIEDEYIKHLVKRVGPGKKW